MKLLSFTQFINEAKHNWSGRFNKSSMDNNYVGAFGHTFNKKETVESQAEAEKILKERGIPYHETIEGYNGMAHYRSQPEWTNYVVGKEPKTDETYTSSMTIAAYDPKSKTLWTEPTDVMKDYHKDPHLAEGKKKDDEVEVDVTKPQQAYYKDLPKSTATKKKSQIAKQADMDSDDPNAYKELPGDKKAQRQGKVKTSKYTSAYHKKYGKKNESIDEAAKKDDGKPDEKLLNQGPIGNPDIEKALKKKQEETGVDIKILRAVMRKGMAAWRSGHRPGATQEQWGYARVNSFLTGGKTIGTTKNPGPDGRLGKMAKLI